MLQRCYTLAVSCTNLASLLKRAPNLAYRKLDSTRTKALVAILVVSLHSEPYWDQLVLPAGLGGPGLGAATLASSSLERPAVGAVRALSLDEWAGGLLALARIGAVGALASAWMWMG